jgi:hypothetical protein
MVGRAARRFRHDALKPQPPLIQLVDEDIDRPHRIGLHLRNRQGTRAAKPLAFGPRPQQSASSRTPTQSIRILTQPTFSHSLPGFGECDPAQTSPDRRPAIQRRNPSISYRPAKPPGHIKQPNRQALYPFDEQSYGTHGLTEAGISPFGGRGGDPDGLWRLPRPDAPRPRTKHRLGPSPAGIC